MGTFNTTTLDCMRDIAHYVCMDGPAFLSPGEAARRTGLSPETLGRYAATGILTAIRTPGNHRRYSTSSVMALIAEATS